MIKVIDGGIKLKYSDQEIDWVKDVSCEERITSMVILKMRHDKKF
ncbi:hypothetical protein [Nitrosomonas communis]|nr:hypothetical protein [Nitrosomonas communis]